MRMGSHANTPPPWEIWQGRSWLPCSGEQPTTLLPLRGSGVQKSYFSHGEATPPRSGENTKGDKNTQMIHNRNAQRARVSSRAERGATTPATAGNQAVEEWVPMTHGPRPCDPALRHHRQKRDCKKQPSVRRPPPPTYIYILTVYMTT